MIGCSLAGRLLEASVGVTPGAPLPAAVYLALLIDGARGGVSRAADLPEASYPGYVRVLVPPTSWAAPDALGTLVNDAEILLAPNSGQPVTIFQAALVDALVGDGEVCHVLDVPPFILTAADPAPRLAVGIVELQMQ
jgi:hypothetical protein